MQRLAIKEPGKASQPISIENALRASQSVSEEKWLMGLVRMLVLARLRTEWANQRLARVAMPSLNKEES